MVRRKGGTVTALFSKEGVARDDPLAMLGYGIGILPLIRHLKDEFLEVMQPLYANDAGTQGCFSDMCCSFSWLQEIGPSYGYFPELSKSILVIQEHNQTSAKLAFTNFDFKVRTGYRYLCSFIGSMDKQPLWLKAKVSNWTSVIADLACVVLSRPQSSAYAGLQKSLQQEWQFIQRVVEGVGEDFSEIEKAITNLFLPSLLETSLMRATPITISATCL
jgi:hypothetical protein